jgi:putative ABC transport system substrate-binding protein
MKRRAVLAFAATVFAVPARALAQTRRPFRVGYLSTADEASTEPLANAFVAGLRVRGYVPGRNVTIDMRYARGDYNRLPALAEELLSLKPDVVIGIEASAQAFRSRSTRIPIVLVASADPVAAGLALSLARPGTNVTGMAYRQDQLITKHVELLTEIVPKLQRIALLNYAASAGEPVAPLVARYEQYAKAAAAAKGVALIVTAARDPESVRQAFSHIEKERAQGVVVGATGSAWQLRREIVAEARRLRLPSISALPAAWVEAGGLATYGPNFLESFRYAAIYVDRILKGANPAEMPIEQPEKFELVLSLATARELGLKIPAAVLVRADRVIE